VRGDPGMLRDMGFRLTGSSDLYGEDGRSPYHSINFVTCHDGFTLNDLVTYEKKHNEANGEKNADGNNCNDSANYGVEGPTEVQSIIDIRRRQVKNFMVALIVSRGVPMIMGGDEFLRTQSGNNNAYCHDSPLTWFDWNLMETERRKFRRFVRMLLRFKAAHPVLAQEHFYLEACEGGCEAEIIWHGTDGGEPQWENPDARAIAFHLNGSAIKKPVHVQDNDLFVILNSGGFNAKFTLPESSNKNAKWYRIVDTSLPDGEDIVDESKSVMIEPPGFYILNGYSSAVLLAK